MFLQGEVMEKRTKLDSLLWKLVDRYAFYIVMCILLIISFLIRFHLAPICVLSADYNNFIVPWVEKYRELGLVGGLSQKIGDYYVPYNVLLAIISLFPWKPYVLVSLTSCIAEYISAFFIYKISVLLLNERAVNMVKEKACLIAIATLYLPFVFLNSALWKQCDAIYTCFMVISLYMMLREKYTQMMIFFSIGFCFKLQAVMLLPVFVIVYFIRKRFSILQFLWVPVMYLITGIPAVICGKGLKPTYRVYFRQTGEYNGMSINAPNIYQFGLGDYPALSKVAVMVTIGIIAVAALYCFYERKNMNMCNTVYMSAWEVWTCFMFLPAMHERYDYAAIILITAVIFATGNIKMIWAPVIMNICAIITYSKCLMGGDFSIQFASVIYCIAYFAVTCDCMMTIRGKGKV